MTFDEGVCGSARSMTCCTRFIALPQMTPLGQLLFESLTARFLRFALYLRAVVFHGFEVWSRMIETTLAARRISMDHGEAVQAEGSAPLRLHIQA